MNTRLIKNIRNQQRGFIALIAVIMLVYGTIAVSLIVLAGAYSYEDSVIRRELRIQARLNMEACLDQAVLMLASNFLLSGTVKVDDFNCVLTFSNTSGNVTVVATTSMSYGPYGVSPVSVQGQEILRLNTMPNNQSIDIISR